MIAMDISNYWLAPPEEQRAIQAIAEVVKVYDGDFVVEGSIHLWNRHQCDCEYCDRTEGTDEADEDVTQIVYADSAEEAIAKVEEDLREEWGKKWRWLNGGPEVTPLDPFTREAHHV